MAMPAAFGRYELQKLLALGGMAEIFLARSLVGGIERPCVIKRVLPRLSTSRQFVSMFIDEARITIGLDHEHIVRLFDFGQVDGAYYMALEYVDGCDLVDVLRARKARGLAVPPLVAAWIARCVLKALDHAHACRDASGETMGIVHRDVSPQNIFLGWNGDVKIGDFGIADSNNKLSRTLHGTVKGKFSYMSPEQANGDELDGRSDVFAVGVVLWESLVGGRLFAADSPVDTMVRVLEAPIPAPSELRPEVPAALDAVVLAALRRPLTERTPSAAAMGAELDAVLAREGFDPASLTRLLEEVRHGISDDARIRGTPRTVLAGATVSLPDDARLRSLHLALRRDQNLWTLLDIAERHAELGDEDAALAAARTAAYVFAHRGLPVPAICAVHAFRDLMSEEEFLADLRTLAALRSHDRAALRAALSRVDVRGFFAYIQDADPTGFGQDRTDATRARAPAPLFAALDDEDFARLAAAARLEERAAGVRIVDEGEAGDCLFAIGRGRAVVYTRPKVESPGRERVYVAALSEGDFFGEFSLLTRSPRSATVEAATDILLLRVDRQALTALSAAASVRGPLVEFYKERVAELLLARNPGLGALPVEARRTLLSRSEVQKFKDGAAIVTEGDAGRSAFLVVSGEVEVFHVEDGFPVFIDKLADGQIFGEMAALSGAPRSASVRAIGSVELLVLDGVTLSEVVALSPDARDSLAESMAARGRDAKERIAETVRIFEGV